MNLVKRRNSDVMIKGKPYEEYSFFRKPNTVLYFNYDYAPLWEKTSKHTLSILKNDNQNHLPDITTHLLLKYISDVSIISDNEGFLLSLCLSFSKLGVM